MRKIIIDTDPGIDDAFAVLYALREPTFEVLGLTTVAGNKDLARTTENAIRLSTFSGRHVPVYRGADRRWKAIHENLPAPEKPGDAIHGEDGMGNIKMEGDRSLLQSQHAVDFILETVRAYPGEVELLTLGALTNIALAIEKEPETMKQVKAIHSMGGALHDGNVTPVSEFNYWFDPDAVNVVYGTLGTSVPITMVGLDATRQGMFDLNELHFMDFAGGALGKLLFEMLDVYVKRSWVSRRRLGVIIHDLMVPVGVAHPEIYLETIQGFLQCETESPLSLGQTVVDLRGRGNRPANVRVPLRVDGPRFRREVIRTLFGAEVGALFEEVSAEGR